MTSLAQRITQHFGGEWHGSYGAFPSPAHSKRDRGMTVKDEPDAPDGVLINSFNGGDPIEVKRLCRDAGLLAGRANIGNIDGWRVAGTYEYADAVGTVIYRTVRKEKSGQRKRFVAQRPDGRGGWVNGLGDIQRVPYRLPELLAANPSEPVYFVEGERKADKLAHMGFVATAIAFGCKGWRSEYAGHLAGRTVVILPDSDQDGREFAVKVRAAINDAGGKAAVILELPDLSPKGDVINWTGTADELRALTEAVLHPRPETFALCDLALWAETEPTAKSFALERFIPKREITLASGVGGSNKSLFGEQLCTCHAAGLPMLGVPTAGGPALYLTAEDDERELHWRQAHISKTLNIPLRGLVGKLHLASIRGQLENQLATFTPDGRLVLTSAFQKLRATISATRPALVVLDNVAHLFAGNENDRVQVTAFVNALYSLCNEFDCAIVLIAHPNKTGDDYSGSTAWLNAVRSHIVIKKPDDLDPDLRQLVIGKANYTRVGEEIAFRWHDFALILDSDLTGDQRAEMAANALASTENQRFLECLKLTAEQQRAVSHVNGSNYAPRIFAGMPCASGMKEAGFARAMERLLSMDAIRLDQPLWRGQNRHWKHGIKLASECANPPRQPPAPTRANPPSKSLKTLAPTPARDPPYILRI